MLARYQNGCLQTIVRKGWGGKMAVSLAAERRGRHFARAQENHRTGQGLSRKQQEAAGFVSWTAAKHQHRWPDGVDFDHYD